MAKYNKDKWKIRSVFLIVVMLLFAGLALTLSAFSNPDSGATRYSIAEATADEPVDADDYSEEAGAGNPHGHSGDEEDEHVETPTSEEVATDNHGEAVGASNAHGHSGDEEDEHVETPTSEEVATDNHGEEVAGSLLDDAHGHADNEEEEHAETTAGEELAADSHETTSEIGDGHGHGKPQIGYIGIEDKKDISERELNAFVERVEDEAYAKGDIDQFRFILFGLFFVLIYLAFAKIKTGNISTRLRNAIDWHTLGTVSGIILIFLVIPSGIIITFFYMPTSTEAYSSVQNMADQPVLAFFRNLHNWSSEIFMILSLLHAARAISTRTFLGKRKLIWLLGAVAIIVGWVAFLSGTFMRGDQEALEGFAHMMYSFTLVPLGRYISDFFSGEYTMMKLTALHVGGTIFIIAVTLVLHVLMRKVHVLVTQRWKKALAYSVALTLLLVTQSLFMEAPFIRGPESGPTVSGIEATKPPWPIYFLIQGENWFGANAMVAILAIAFVPLIIFPYAVEFLPLTKAKKGRTGEILFYVGIFLMLAISYIAAAGEIQAHIF